MAGRANRGSPIYHVRLPIDLATQLEVFVHGRVIHARGEPPSASDVIRGALREYLEKSERARRSRARKRQRLNGVLPAAV